MYNNQCVTCFVLHTSILALFQSLPCYQCNLHEEGSLDPTLSEHSRNKTKSKIFETSTSMHVLRCNMQCMTCNVLYVKYDMLCAVTINDYIYSQVLSSSLQLEMVNSLRHQLVKSAHKQIWQNSVDDDNMVVEQNDSNIVIVSVRISHMWQCHVSQITDTERNNGVSEGRASLVIHVTKSCHSGDRVNLGDNDVMRKEPVMTESKGQRCLLERTCYVTSTGEIHELEGPQPIRAYTLVE